MSSADDKRFRQLLMAFELDILSEEDRAWMELKIMENKEYYRLANENLAAARLMKFDPDVKELVNDIDNLNSAATETESRENLKNSRSKFWKIMIPVTALLLIILVLWDWDFTIKPTKEAYASKNRLMILPFTDFTETPGKLEYGKLISSLLITDLAESKYLQIIPNQYMYDILKRMNYDLADSIATKESIEMAALARAHWIVVGDIIQSEPELVVVVQIIDAGSSKIIGSVKLSGKPGDSLFAIVDSLSVIIKSELNLPEKAITENDRQVSEITTSNPEAYQTYLMGLSAYNRHNYPEAIVAFERTVNFDSTFAMAYYYLSKLKNQEYIKLASKYIDKASTRDKYFIRSQDALIAGDVPKFIKELQDLIAQYPDEKEAYYSLASYYYGQMEYRKALEQLDLALTIDPEYGRAMNLKAYTYDKLGDFENTILTINDYISLNPDEANPYDTRGDLYAGNGQLERAIESYELAIKINPNFYASWRKLGIMFIYDQQYARADSCFTRSIPEYPDDTLVGLSSYNLLPPWYEGNWSLLQKRLDHIISVKTAQKRWDFVVSNLQQNSYYLYFTGNYPGAISKFEQTLKISEEYLPDYKVKERHYFILMLVANNEIDRARKVLEEIKDDLGEDYTQSYQYWWGKGIIELNDEDLKAAIASFEKSYELLPVFPVSYQLAKTYLEIGRFDKTIELLEKENNNYNNSWRLFLVDWNISLHYYLGRAYEGSHWAQKAIDQYQAFLSFEPYRPQMSELFKDARSRLNRLSNGT